MRLVAFVAALAASSLAFGQNRAAEVPGGARPVWCVQHTPEDAYAFVKNEVTKWEPVVKRAGVVPD